jgi:hypothetical protein
MSQMNNWQYVFQRLTHFSIVCLIITDFFFELMYLPSSILRAWFLSFDKMLHKASGVALIFFSELSEWMFCASGVWSFFIALSIFLSIKHMNQEITGLLHDTDKYKQAILWKRSLKYGMALLAWGATGVCAMIWIWANERYTVFPKSPTEYV